MGRRVFRNQKPRQARKIAWYMANKPSHTDAVRDSITARQQHVAALISHGLSNEEIGKLIGISTETVKEHVQMILRITGLRNRVEICGWWLFAQ